MKFKSPFGIVLKKNTFSLKVFFEKKYIYQMFGQNLGNTIKN